MRFVQMSTVSIIALAIAASLGSHAIAQDVEETVTSRTSVALYEADFLTSYAPVTALDMVERVPGFSLSDGNTNRRGLGDRFGNILIDGARPANKSLDLQTVLQRIPVSQVVRIELIQEAIPEFDMRGHSRLVNVILREGTESSGSWDALLRLSPSGRIGPEINASYTSNMGPIEVTFGISAHTNGFVTRTRKVTFDENNELQEFQRDNDQRHLEWISANFSANWTIDDASNLLFDGRSSYWEWRPDHVGFVDDASGLPLRFEQNQLERIGESYSGSMTYNRDLTPQISIQTIALASSIAWDDGLTAYETYDPVLGFLGATIVASSTSGAETAFRQTLSFDPTDNHAFEFGAETAVNSHETRLALAYNDGTTIETIEIPVANTRVEETR
ncbi:MAG: hypothetical protein JKY00_16025, partial [Roseicyclus sp.]|nr:hypothetical protein [Roseicyclus sp.]